MSNGKIATLIGVGMAMGMDMSTPIYGLDRGWYDRPKRTCALPGCEKVSVKHYCCAEHCNEHKELDKKLRNQANDKSTLSK